MPLEGRKKLRSSNLIVSESAICSLRLRSQKKKKKVDATVTAIQSASLIYSVGRG